MVGLPYYGAIKLPVCHRKMAPFFSPNFIACSIS